MLLCLYMNKTAYELADSGEIVSTKSVLALDEDYGCRKCGAKFTLAEAVYEEAHEVYSLVTKHGFKCPSCENVNFAYVKTPRLRRLEQNIQTTIAPLRQKARRKYQREFRSVQKQFGFGIITE